MQLFLHYYNFYFIMFYNFMNKQVICTACQTPAGWVIWFENTDLHTAAFICAYGHRSCCDRYRIYLFLGRSLCIQDSYKAIIIFMFSLSLGIVLDLNADDPFSVWETLVWLQMLWRLVSANLKAGQYFRSFIHSFITGFHNCFGSILELNHFFPNDLWTISFLFTSLNN